VPIYEYACLSCGTHVEVYQRFSEEPLTVCGVCSGPLRKVFHPAGILFKGSGFYATDSRAKSKSAGEGERSEVSAGQKSGSGSPKADGVGSKAEGGSSDGDAGASKGEPAGRKGSTRGARSAKEKSA
jgi:putative FmdB family regulatory protein